MFLRRWSRLAYKLVGRHAQYLLVYVVGSNMVLFYPEFWGIDTIWRACFSDGWKPPTTHCIFTKKSFWMFDCSIGRWFYGYSCLLKYLEFVYFVVSMWEPGRHFHQLLGSILKSKSIEREPWDSFSKIEQTEQMVCSCPQASQTLHSHWDTCLLKYEKM